MDSFNKHANTLLLSACMVLALIGYGSSILLAGFEEVFTKFEVDFPFWLAWVMPSFHYWPLTAIIYLALFIISFVAPLKSSKAFNRFSVGFSIMGFMLTVLLVLFTMLTIYWPLASNTQ